MGAFDGTEVCEMVGIYKLYLLISKCNKGSIGLYCDDGLSVFKNKSGPHSEKIKNDFEAIFNGNSLKLEIKCILQSLYIHKKANHPPNIIKQIPSSIETWLSKVSYDKEILNEAAEYYDPLLTQIVTTK